MAGNYVVTSAGQSKALVGSENLFSWAAPEPLAASPTASCMGVTITGDLAPSVVVTAVRDGRKRLDLATLPTSQLAGARGAAYLCTPATQWSTTVTAYGVDDRGPHAVLAEPLPAAVPPGVDMTLHYALVTFDLPLQTTPLKNNVLIIEYTPLRGDATRRVTYLIDYVRQVFSTGLGEQDVRRRLSRLPSVPASDAGIQSALASGEDALIMELRRQLADRGLDEDAIPASATLRYAHELYAAASLYRLPSPDLYDRLTTEARDAVRVALRDIWIDADQSGDPPDENTNLTGRRGADLRVGRRRRGGCRR